MNHIIRVSERAERHIRKLCELSHHPRGRAVSSRCAGLVLISAVAAFLTQTPPALAQIAARYPRDKNIASDPAVIFADDFESYTNASQLATKWSKVAHVEHMRIATETGNRFAGAKGLEMSLPISSREVSASLQIKDVNTDTLFVRVYEKWATNYHVAQSNHNGIQISGGTPAGPGIAAPANGTGFFTFLLQNILSGRPGGMTDPGYDEIYAYWPKQRSDFGDHWFPDGWVVPGGEGDWLLYPARYDDFRAKPNHLPQRNRWYCYELMVRANTPWLSDGEVKWWVDGKLTADFPDLKIRSIPTLKIDMAKIVLGANRTTQVVKKWYDNVVIAKHYIGPMVSP
jgi:hypothetical protein